jgi:hypothetical protein
MNTESQKLNAVPDTEFLTKTIWDIYQESGVEGVDKYMKETKLPWSILQTEGEAIVAAANERNINLQTFLNEWEEMMQRKWDNNEKVYEFKSFKDDPDFTPVDEGV